jgi:hypothetical protein
MERWNDPPVQSSEITVSCAVRVFGIVCLYFSEKGNKKVTNRTGVRTRQRYGQTLGTLEGDDVIALGAPE